MGDPIEMLVTWNQQTRIISLKTDDDVTSIENMIMNTFQLVKLKTFTNYQIQYYDNNRQTFIDLYPQTLEYFKKLLQKLSSNEAPTQSSNEWKLRIVPKVNLIKFSKAMESTTDDTYQFQQDNDLIGFNDDDDITHFTENHLDKNQQMNVQNDCSSEIHSHTDDQKDTSVVPNPLLSVQPLSGRQHPYSLNFYCPLTEFQRLQFESDIFRKCASKCNKGGVLLRAVPKSDPTSKDEINYPSVHFTIPGNELQLDWSMFIYVLTVSDTDGIHYLHASKAIYDNSNNDDNKFGAIKDTKLFNPYIVQLTQDHVRDGRYELRLKVCNIANLPTLKRSPLKEFPRLHSPIMSEVEKLLTTKTMADLNFSNEKYHIGCILVKNKIAHDICISNLTTAQNCRKRVTTEQTAEGKHGHGERKRRLESE